jgi:hypothetical protein
MCIRCRNNILSVVDSLCSQIKNFKVVSPLIQPALSNTSPTSAESALQSAKVAVAEILNQIITKGTVSGHSHLHDTEKVQFSVLVDWITPALTCLFTNSCSGVAPQSLEQRRLLKSLLAVNSAEAFAVSLLAALIVSYRDYNYGQIPDMIAASEFEASVLAEVAITNVGTKGGHEWRNQNFGRYKQDHLMKIFRNEGDGFIPDVGCRICWYCSGPTLKGAARFLCRCCKFTVYCGRECQKKDWKLCHKKICGHLKSHRAASTGREGESMVASAYYKWKSGTGIWKPHVCGQPHFQAMIDVLESLELSKEEVAEVVKDEVHDAETGGEVESKGESEEESSESLHQSDDDSADSGEEMGSYGFTRNEEEELMAHGVKPWDDNAASVLAVLNLEECDY